MKIASFAHSLPETKLSNDDVIDLFRENSKPHLDEEKWAEIERRISFFLKMSGINSRRVAVNGEASLDLAISASVKALDAAGVKAKDIDLIIYASVARGWLEPCMAVAVQNRLKARNATSFDVLDACAGWLRAMHVAHSMLKSGAYRNVLIVNLESGMLDFVRFQLKNTEDINRYGAAATLGNAATATLLHHTDIDDFYFNIRTFAEDMNLCMMPLENADGFLPYTSDNENKLVPCKFMADSTPLLTKTVNYIADVFKKDNYLRKLTYDITFSHAVGARVNRFIAKETKIPLGLHFSTHEEFGNTASASVPLAMSLALESGRLMHGQRVGIVIGSAGITVGLATFTF